MDRRPKMFQKTMICRNTIIVMSPNQTSSAVRPSLDRMSPFLIYFVSVQVNRNPSIRSFEALVLENRTNWLNCPCWKSKERENKKKAKGREEPKVTSIKQKSACMKIITIMITISSRLLLSLIIYYIFFSFYNIFIFSCFVL